MPETKSIFASKSAALGALTVALGFIPGSQEFIAENPEASLAILGILQVILRLVTSKKAVLFSGQ